MVPDDKDVPNLVKRLQEYKVEYFRFARTAIPPTNNPEKQAIRKDVLSEGTQGTWSDWTNR